MNEIELKTTKLDWLKLINMTLDRKDWGKTFNLHIYGDVVITIIMKQFNFIENEAEFKIQCNYKGQYSDVWYNTIYINYKLNHFKIKDFERLLNKEIKYLISKLIDKEKQNEAHNKYCAMQTYKSQITDEKIEESEYSKDYNIACNLSGNFGENVIDDIKEKICYNLNREYRNCVREFKETYKLEETELENYYNKLNPKEE